jgi:hypothetical protein
MSSPIIGPFPNQILAGQVISALPVMQDFEWIRSQVNANLAGSIPANATSIPTYVGLTFVGGTANAITLTPTPAISAYVAGQRFAFLATAPNTGPVTINTSSLGPRALVYADASPLGGDEILGGSVYDIIDNGTNYTLLNSSQGSSIITWAPVIAFGGATTGITYSLQTGKAWKFGRLMYFTFDVVLTSKGSATGGITIDGLPFIINAGWLGNSPSQAYVYNVTFGTGYVIMFYYPGTTQIGMANIVSGSPALPMTDTSFSNSSQIAGNGFYVV